MALSQDKRIGADIGGSSLKIAAVSKDKIIEKRIVKITSKTKKDKIVAELCKNAYELCKKHGAEKIGIACAGLITKEGKIRFSPNLKILNDVNLKKEVEDCFKNFEIKVINDVNAHAVAEKKFGKAKNFKSFIILALGTGVGGSLFIDDKLYLGMHGFAGEIGHSKVFVDIEKELLLKCECSAYNCLETFAGARYISRRAKKIFGRKISSEELFYLAEKGNEKAIKIFEISGKAIGMAIANLANALDITNFIISGGVSRAGKFIINPAKKEFKKHALKEIRERTKILLSRFKEDAGIIGAANAFDIKTL